MRNRILLAYVLLPILSLGAGENAGSGYARFDVAAQQAGTPARQALANWLEAFDSPNRQAYKAFIQNQFPSGMAHIDQDTMLWDNTGGFDLMKIEDETPTKITALLQERAGDDFARISVEIESSAPHRIVKIEVVPVMPRPAGFPLPHLSEKDLVAQLRKLLSESAAAGRFSGAVLVAENGKRVFAQAYGFADREHDIPNRLDSRFSIGSLNKMFTGVAVLQLVQAGKLQLDDRLGKYLTSYPNKELAAKVTIGELLTNTGGTGDIWGPDFTLHRAELNTLADYVSLYGDRPLRFEPGSRWEYSNYGFILLGRVIEVVSGESYDEYVSKHVYAPAGMNSTGSEPEDEGVPRLSFPYTRMGSGTWHPATEELSIPGTSAGGGYSTVGDLLRFANALREGMLLNAHYTTILTTPRVKNPLGFNAYGFEVQALNGTQCYGHNGVSSGVNSDFEVCRNSTFVVISLANLDPPSAQRISEFAIDRLPLQ